MRFGLLVVLATLWGATNAWAEPALVVKSTGDLKKALGAKDYAQARTCLERVKVDYKMDEATEANRKAAVAAVGKAAGSSDKKLRFAAFDVLAEWKAKGSGKYLRKWLKAPKKGIVSQSTLKAIDTCGTIADAGMLSSMRKLADHKNIQVAVAATRALGGYRTLNVAKRKKLAFELVKRMEKLQGGNGSRGWGRGGPSTDKTEDQDGHHGDTRPGQTAMERRRTLLSATGAALRQLTGETMSSTAEWTGWRHRNKKERDPFQNG
ncbi:MAG: hypothetical protein AAGD14_09240 [Planctomycetota bacterium]